MVLYWNGRLHTPGTITPHGTHLNSLEEESAFAFFIDSVSFHLACLSAHLLQGGETLTTVDTLCPQSFSNLAQPSNLAFVNLQTPSTVVHPCEELHTAFLADAL